VTGDRPTGKLHLGHYVGSLMNRLLLQDSHTMYIIIADTQVMNNDMMRCKDTKKNIIEIIKDYLAVGLNPYKCTIFLQSDIPELFELTTYLSNITTLGQVLRNPTIKVENETYNNTMSLGFINYPVSQTADVILFDGECVPVGEDQLPILDLANDIIGRFNHLFKPDFFKKIKPMISSTPRLLGPDGKKMSKSLGNAIYLSDSKETVDKIVYSMYTDEGHLKVSDPGKIEGNVVFSYLDVFHTDKEELQALKEHYMRGGLGDVALKKILMKDIDAVLSPIRETRRKITALHAEEVLFGGTFDAQKVAKERMELIKSVIYG
jgi:tryptophanyl-tRNA synthetase